MNVCSQRLNCFLGVRLHQTPDKPLETFGIFNGNRIILVGDKVCYIRSKAIELVFFLNKSFLVVRH